MYAIFVQAEEGSDEVYCQVVLVPESEVRPFFSRFHFGESAKKGNEFISTQNLGFFST